MPKTFYYTSNVLSYFLNSQLKTHTQHLKSYHITICYGLSVKCSPSEIHMLEINPQYDGQGTFGRYLGHEGRALMDGNSALNNKDCTGLSFSFHHKRIWAIKGPSLNHAVILIVDPPPPETVRNKCLLFISYLVLAFHYSSPSKIIPLFPSW